MAGLSLWVQSLSSIIAQVVAHQEEYSYGKRDSIEDGKYQCNIEVCEKKVQIMSIYQYK